jgi:hypothetical protein
MTSQPQNDNRSIAIVLCDGLLEQAIPRAKSSAARNRAMSQVGSTVKALRTLGGLLITGLVGYWILEAYLDIWWLSALVTAAGLALLGFLSVYSTKDQRRHATRLEQIDEDLLCALYSDVNQLNAIAMQLESEGMPGRIFETKTLEQIERDVASYRQQLAHRGGGRR